MRAEISRWLLFAIPTLPACAPVPDSAWVVDRGAGEIVALDAELRVTARHPATEPARLLATTGALWSLPDPLHSTGAWIERIDLATLERRATDLEPPLEGCAEGDGLVVIEGAGEAWARLWRLGPELGRVLLGAFPGATCVAVQARTILVGARSGACFLLDHQGALAAQSIVALPARRVCAGPTPGRWWLLGVGTDSRLELLGPDLQPLWTVVLAGEALDLAPVPGQERAWVLVARGLRLHGPGGTLELEQALPGGPFVTARATPGRVLVAALGAVLELASDGGRLRVRRAQGGFDALSDLTLAPSGRAARRPRR